MRDEMGIQGGVENLQWLFTGTLLVMAVAVPLFGWVSSRFTRQRFLPYIYFFFIFMLLLFYILMDEKNITTITARTFFIWASVFNLFVVSVFWSFMTDLYNDTQAKRLFGFIAAGGTIGALVGPMLTALLVEPLGMRNLLLVSALFLGWAVVCIWKLSAWSNARDKTNTETTISNTTARFTIEPSTTGQSTRGKADSDKALEGGLWSGVTLVFKSPYLLGICILIFLFTSLSTFLYFMQAEIIRDAFVVSAQRTEVFALIDLAVNTLTLLIQIFLTSRLIKWFGLAMTLAFVPLLLVIGFSLLAIAPMLLVMVGVQVIRRSGNYAIMRPAREMLYVVLSREEKYKAKNFIDTFIYRTGDAISAWLFAGLRSLGMSFSGIALLAIPLTIIWAWVAFNLGRQQEKISEDKLRV